MPKADFRSFIPQTKYFALIAGILLMLLTAFSSLSPVTKKVYAEVCGCSRTWANLDPPCEKRNPDQWGCGSEQCAKVCNSSDLTFTSSCTSSTIASSCTGTIKWVWWNGSDLSEHVKLQSANKSTGAADTSEKNAPNIANYFDTGSWATRTDNGWTGGPYYVTLACGKKYHAYVWTDDMYNWNGGISHDAGWVDGPTCPPNASCVSNTIPTTMYTGQTQAVSVVVNNNGNVAWTSGGSNPYRLGIINPQDSMLWGISRNELPSSPINGGSNATFNFNITAPSTPGTYANQWKMVQEGVTWFGSTCGPASVTVVNQPPTPTPIPTNTPTPTPTPIPTPIPLLQWFQVSGNGGIIAANRTSGTSINDILPNGKYFFDPLSSGGIIIAAASTSFNLSQTHPQPAERHLVTNYGPITSSYNYTYFKNKYASRDFAPDSSAGPVLPANLTGKSYYYYSNPLGALTVNAGTYTGNAVIIVEGDLSITGNITLSANSALAFFVKGRSGGGININGSVASIKGFFLTSGRFDDGVSGNQLTVTGGVVANDFALRRNLGGNSQPAELFVSDPSIFVNLNSILGERRYTWYEVAE